MLSASDGAQVEEKENPRIDARIMYRSAYFILVVIALVWADSKRFVRGDVLVSSHNTNEVLQFDDSGNFVRVFASASDPTVPLSRPFGLVLAPNGEILVASDGTNQILKFDRVTGAYKGALVPPFGCCIIPDDLVIGPNGQLLVSNFNGVNDTGVVGFDLDSGSYTGPFISHDQNAAGSQLRQASGLLVTTSGTLLVSGRNVNRVFEYDGQTGAFLRTAIPRFSPVDLLQDRDGNILVSSLGSDVVRYDLSTGRPISIAAQGGGLSAAFGMVFGPGGDLLVVSRFTDQVLRYDGQTGDFKEVFIDSGILQQPTYLLYLPIPEPPGIIMLQVGIVLLFVVACRNRFTPRQR